MMKSLLLLAGLLLMVSIHVSGQAYHGIETYPIYKQGAQLVYSLDEQGKEIVRIEYDLLFSSKSTYRSLTSSWEYSVVGFADQGVKELQLLLYEYDDLIEQWTQVASSVSEEGYSVLTYQPTATAQYRIDIVARAFHEGYTAARYGLIIFHD